ncbi:alpha/beta fold hydrolase [Desertimonas flava]|jgi:non-heme chloroperoxidase|uniref:alpha/beta fold hydrolase n=1 Tax=Desertimonas flava TaxID=2064846 RepID=UPI000E340BA0|nr:alpha/beta hydrolase [Desertimonas flava]
MKYLAGVDGATIAADHCGDLDDPAVLLFHGGGQTRHAWGGALEALAAAGWNAWSFDLRGHGDSSWSDDGQYTIERFAGDVAAVAGQFDRPSIVGASLGGIASLAAVGEGLAPDVHSLVLVDITPSFEADGARRVHDFMTQGINGFASLDDVADAVAAYLPQRPRPRDPDGLRKNLRQGDDGRWYWHWDPNFLQLGDSMEERHPFGSDERMFAAARAVEIPTLLVRGALSDVVTADGAAAFTTFIPHAEVAEVGGAGHMVAGDRNDDFNAAILDFLDRHRP